VQDVPYHIANTIIINNQSMATNINSLIVNINEVILIGIIASWSGTSPIGTLNIEASNDGITFDTIGSLSVSGNNGVNSINIQELGFGFLQVVYTATSGTGNLTVSCNQKSL
jgi:spore coat protein U-like protein